LAFPSRPDGKFCWSSGSYRAGVLLRNTRPRFCPIGRVFVRSPCPRAAPKSKSVMKTDSPPPTPPPPPFCPPRAIRAPPRPPVTAATPDLPAAPHHELNCPNRCFFFEPCSHAADPSSPPPPATHFTNSRVKPRPSDPPATPGSPLSPMLGSPRPSGTTERRTTPTAGPTFSRVFGQLVGRRRILALAANLAPKALLVPTAPPFPPPHRPPPILVRGYNRPGK